MNLILPEPTRVDKLKGWLYTRRLTYEGIGQTLGLTSASVLKIVNSETARPERVEQLKSLGIPEELLPEPRYIPPGPKPKRQNS